MAAPTFIQEAETAWTTNADATASVTTASFSVVAGDVLVAFGVTGDNSVSLTLSHSGGAGIVFTQKQAVAVAAYTWVSVWTATVDANKSMTVTFTRSVDPGSTILYGGNVLTFRGSDGVGASSKTNVSSGAPTLNITTTQANSAVVVASGDWSAQDGASRTWRTNAGTLTEQTYFRNTTDYAVYGGYHADAGAVSTYAVGLTAPGSQKYSIVAVEIKGAAASGSTGTLATTNANDTSAASGTTTVAGTLARTNANDTSAAAGTTTVLGTLARTNANDTSAASGTTTVVGTLATTNANDTLAASGSAGAVSGTLATANANDTSSAAGTTTVLGTLARTNANDASVASGTTTVTGTLARTNADDTLSASGAAGAITGTLAYTNANDTLSASGTVTPPASAETFSGGFPDYGTLRERKRKEPEPIEIAELPQAVIAVLPQAIKRRKTVTLDQLIGAAEQADVSLIDIEVIFQAAERKKRQQDDEEILLFY